MINSLCFNLQASPSAYINNNDGVQRYGSGQFITIYGLNGLTVGAIILYANYMRDDLFNFE